MFIKLKSRYNGEIYLNVNHILKIIGYAKSVTELTFLNSDHVVLVEETPEEIMKLIEFAKYGGPTVWAKQIDPSEVVKFDPSEVVKFDPKVYEDMRRK